MNGRVKKVADHVNSPTMKESNALLVTIDMQEVRFYLV